MTSARQAVVKRIWRSRELTSDLAARPLESPPFSWRESMPVLHLR